MEGRCPIPAVVRAGDRGQALGAGAAGGDHADRNGRGTLFTGRLPHGTPDVVAADPFVYFPAFPDAPVENCHFRRAGAGFNCIRFLEIEPGAAEPVHAPGAAPG